MAKRVIIIGGGIIGYCSAYYLSESGHDVTIVDKSSTEHGCSYKNAGMVVPSHIIPLASPGIIWTAIKWMLRNDSPFRIKPRLNSDLLKWGWLFYQNAEKEHVQRSVPILAELNNRSRDLYIEMNSSLKDDFSFSTKGLLMLYNTIKAEKEEWEASELANKVGIDTQILTNDQLNQLDGGVRYDVRGAVFYPGDAFFDPSRFMKALKEHLLAKGVSIVHGPGVSDFDFSDGRIRGIICEDAYYDADEYVMAAGIYSSELAKKSGCYLPMQGGKGYSVTVKKPDLLPEICSILTEARVAVTPMSGNLRLAGTMEIAGLDLSVQSKRVNGYLRSIKDYIPDYTFSKIGGNPVWAGLRPCSPDGMPYLGRTSKFNNLIFATGHAMMGMSLGPVSGRIVADLVEGNPVFSDINQLSPDRFS